MAIKEKETLEEYISRIEYKTYTDIQLKDFHNKIQRFYEDYTDSFSGKTFKVLQKDKLLKAFGAIGPTGGIVLSNITRHKSGSIASYDRPTRMEQFDNLWKQYEDWKWKNGLVKESPVFKRTEALEKMAEQMKVEEVRVEDVEF